MRSPPRAGSTLAVMARRKGGAYLVIAVASVTFVACSTGSASGATPTESGYACELVRAGVVSSSFGKGLQTEKRPTEAAASFGEESFGSGCTLIVTKKRKEAAGRPRSTHSSGRFRVGAVRVSTVVAAEGVPEEKWSAEAQEATELSYVALWISAFGGSAYPMDTFGQSDVHAYLLGSKELSTEAFWRHGETGEISIGLHDRSELSSRLEQLLSRIAGGIVPGFSP